MTKKPSSLIYTDNYLLLTNEEVNTLDYHVFFNKDLSVVLSHLPLNDNKLLDGIPLMSLEDFIVWDFEFVDFENVIILAITQGRELDNINMPMENRYINKLLNNIGYDGNIYDFVGREKKEKTVLMLTDFLNSIKSKYK